ncbi:DoxX family protein [Saccharothrix deserti]|uniref:DoxX family protein n=1 Tax=Saccharothrix deserti TaxID=2593674 RepID=UPI00131AEFC7|nr:DoxX family protein [Saccharothrix deserti]
MFIAYVVVTVVTVLANAGMAVADFVKAEFVPANSAEVGVPPSWLPMPASLKAAGAVGLLLGLLGAEVVGVVAAVGLVVFFVGAIVVHVRAKVLHNVVQGPGAYLAPAVASLVLSLSSHPG